MSSYTNIFTGTQVTSIDRSYLAFPLNANSILYWPSQFIDIPIGSTTTATVARIMDITPGGGGLTLRLPDATLVSKGEDILFTNTTGTAFNLIANDGVTVIATIGANQATYIYLTSNATTNGAWRSTPFAGGVAAVTSIGMAVSNNNLTVGSSTTNPIVANGTFTIGLALDLLALTGFAGGTGYAARTGAGTWSLRTYTGTANQIQLTNPGGVAGTTNFALANDVSGIQTLTVLNGLRLNANSLINTAANNMIISPQAGFLVELTSALNIEGNTGLGTTNPIRFYNPANTFFTSFQAGILTSDISYIWPTTAPAVSQVLRVSAIGSPNTLEWAAIPTFPGVSTVNAVAKYLDTVGSLQNSGVIIDGANAITGVTSLTSGNLILAANTISTSIGSINLTPNGASVVIMTGLTYPTSVNPGNIESCSLTANGLNTLVFSANVNENILINGAMDIWQRNTTFTNATFFVNNSNIYTADAWRLESGINAGAVNDVVNVSKFARAYQTAVCSFANVMRFTIVNTGNKFGTFQFIENSETSKVQNQQVSFSFVCAGSTATNIRAGLISWTGAADTVTKPVVTAWNAAGVTPTLAANWAFIGGNPANTPITANLARFKFENLTVPAGCNNLGIFIWYDDATSANGQTVDISAVKIEQGPSCTAFNPRPIEEELQLCERRFGKDLPLSVAVGTVTSASSNMFIPIIGAFPIPASGGGGNTDFTSIYGNLAWNVEMRTAPTVTFYSYTAATTGMASQYISDGAGTPLYTDYAANTAITISADTRGCKVRNQSAGTIAVATAGFNLVVAHHYRTADL